MKLPSDTDFGGPLTALVWVCILLLPICLLAIVIGAPSVSNAASKVIYGDFALLTTLVGLKTMAISRRSNGSRDDSRGGRDA